MAITDLPNSKRDSTGSLESIHSASSTSSKSSRSSTSSKASKRLYKNRPIHSSTIVRPLQHADPNSLSTSSSTSSSGMPSKQNKSTVKLTVEGVTTEEATLTWESTSETVKWYQDTVKHNRASVFVFYRGIWCGFCQTQLRDVNRYVKALAKHNVAVYAVSAQTPETSKRTKALWHLDFDVISDEAHHLPKYFRAHDIGYISVSKRKDYPQGLIQPAIFVIDNAGKVLYNWAITPSISNLHGAANRPAFAGVYETICKALDVVPDELDRPSGCFPWGGRRKGSKHASAGGDSKGAAAAAAAVGEAQHVDTAGGEDTLPVRETVFSADLVTVERPAMQRRTSISTLI